MKKFTLILALIFCWTCFNSCVGAVINIPLRVVVNGEDVNFPDAQPFIDANNRTQVPVAFVSQALGATVKWDGMTKTVTVTQANKKVILVIGKKELDVNGKKMLMDTAALLKEKRTFVPLSFISTALGATVKWESKVKTVYVTTSNAVEPTPTPQGGTVKYYDGIAFNDVADVDQYGRITIEKSEDFLLKLADQLTFVKESGKYYIKCTYPKIPEGYEWSLVIRIFNVDGSYEAYTPTTRVEGFKIPVSGFFSKEASYIKNIANIDSINIGISLDHVKMNNLGQLSIVFGKDATKKKVAFLPNSGLVQQKDYTKTFNFSQMFKWW